MRKRTVIIISIVLLVFIAGFAITYSYFDIRLTENSIRIVRAEAGFFERVFAPLPEGIQTLTEEEFLLAMEEENIEMTDEEFRLFIERTFSPGNQQRFLTPNELDEVIALGVNDFIFEREGISENIINFLFLGDDARLDQDRGRSDTIILISYNVETRVIKLVSFMRDILVPSGLGAAHWNRINIMHALGGPGRIINLINNLFYLDIQRYAVVRFSGVFALVDALEGLEMNLTEAEAVVLNRIFPDYEPVFEGNNVLDGRQVLAYSRIRAIDNDRIRTQRQRNVLTSLFNKVLDTKDIADIFSVAAFILDHVHTNVSLSELLAISLDLFTGERPVLEELRIPIDGSYNHGIFNSAYILTIDFRKNITTLHDFIYDSALDVEIHNFRLPNVERVESVPFETLINTAQ